MPLLYGRQGVRIVVASHGCLWPAQVLLRVGITFARLARCLGEVVEALLKGNVAAGLRTPTKVSTHLI
jgi:hypothetical protein